MITYETYYKDIRQLLDIASYDLLTKRLIDLSLDTENLIYYKKMLDYLDWYDLNRTSSLRSEKLQELLDELGNFLKDKKTKEPEKLFTTKRLEKVYSNSGFILGPISLEISEGQIVGLVGENGNGKTTLLRCLCGELSVSKGILDYHFPYSDMYDLRTKLIYIPQRTPTWYGSLLDNLQFTAAMYGVKGEENECLVDLVIARMGLRQYRDYRWKDLSSGYKMRFELARMLLRKPKLLLIDEPLANLDILAQQVVLDDFRDIAKSPFRPLGIILSSQQLYEVEKTSDQVIFLKQGTPQALVNSAENENGGLSETEEAGFVVEFECEMAQAELHEMLLSLKLIKLQKQGGTYVAHFPQGVGQTGFLSLIISQGIALNYYRNISNSTRRFFLS